MTLAAGAPDSLTALPFPVAYPLAMMHRAADPGRGVNYCIFAAYQAIRTVALVLLADYLDCETVAPELASPIRRLRTPHWGEWITLCTKLCRFWSGPQAERDTRFPELLERWRVVHWTKAKPVDEDWGALLKGMPGLDGRQARGAVAALWKQRNLIAHGTPTSEEADRRLLPKIAAITERLVRALFTPRTLTLLRRVSDGDRELGFIKLHGPHLDLTFELEQLDSEWLGDCGGADIVAVVEDDFLPVFPLFVPLDPESGCHDVGGGGLTEDVAMLDGLTEKKIVLMGVATQQVDFALAEKLVTSLRRKSVDLELRRDETRPWALVDWAGMTAKMTLETMRGKYLPDVYMPRQGIDDLVRRSCDRPGRATLLIGEAGSGKSSLLARLVENLIGSGETCGGASEESGAADRNVVLFLSGRQDYQGDGGLEGDQLLCHAILRKAGVRRGEFASIEKFLKHLDDNLKMEQPGSYMLWFILDAVNEADRFRDLVLAIGQILPTLTQFPWVRMLLSMRSGAYHSLERRHLRESRYELTFLGDPAYLTQFVDQAGSQVPYLEIRPFGERSGEARHAYELRQTRRPDTSSSIPYDEVPEDLRKLIRRPLLLHLFHLAFHDQKAIPPEMGERALLDAYVASLKRQLPGIAVTLKEVGRIMYETRRPELSASTVADWVDNWRSGLDPAFRVVKLDPVEELVAASLLMCSVETGSGRSDGLAYRFSYQRLCEQILRDELHRQLLPEKTPAISNILGWVKQAEALPGGGEFQELTAALALILREMCDAGREAILFAALDASAAEGIPDQPLINACQQLLWNLATEDHPSFRKILTGLSRRPSVSDVAVLIGLFDRLHSNGISNQEEPVIVAAKEEARRLGEPTLLAEVLWRDGNRLYRMGNMKRALSAYQEGEGVVAPDSEIGVRISLSSARIVARDEGRVDEAERLYRKAVDTLRRSGPPKLLATALRGLGNLVLNLGRGEQAITLQREACDICARVHHRVGEAMGLNNLAIAHARAGRLGEAVTCYEEALAIDEDTGNKVLASGVLLNLGIIRKSQGKLDEAEQIYRRSLEIKEAIGQRRGVANLLGCLGELSVIRGHLDEGEALHRRALAIRQAKDDRHGAAYSIASLASIEMQRGKLETAREHYEEVIEIRSERGFTHEIARARLSLVRLALWRDNLSAARTGLARVFADDKTGSSDLKRAHHLAFTLATWEGNAATADRARRGRASFQDDPDLLQETMEIRFSLGFGQLHSAPREELVAALMRLRSAWGDKAACFMAEDGPASAYLDGVEILRPRDRRASEDWLAEAEQAVAGRPWYPREQIRLRLLRRA